MRFAKYHALGNDYLVIDPQELSGPLTAGQIQVICHRNFGVGADGILLGPAPSRLAPFALRIFNPDGSEAEKSGNGLRIFARYLWDRKLVGAEEFAVETAGGLVRCTVMDAGRLVRVEMGQVSFWSDAIPVAGARCSTSGFRPATAPSRFVRRGSATRIAWCRCRRSRRSWRSATAR